jgi:nicotinamidase-related amidase
VGAPGYGQVRIEPGERSAVLVVDLQYAFTDPEFEFATSLPTGLAAAKGAR